ncbi:hypothetical protein [Streptococcus parauberis]|uniref:hypothetical protein n=1 Tax=Streptococcus parauberis TaxID=1348 RepID=UPI000789B9C2|nr:hypothetical protein [Streptococcus parauberis]KYP16964.1 hypothetical protein AKL14_02012 [Streptococcus parauberis]KYP18237.1 hypothetical protein AKL13_01682 [Streptococcus parauberis]KYP20446.1 hypothetical protein TN39_00808 [Streptococcus parauberis]KYP24714.1 hypothetical protein ADO04_00994 [Streptococcus parauberis]KYP27093.1 hypothetical protein TM50_01007 [Streptococcus parauberis]
MTYNIEVSRQNTYQDSRFSQEALNQHGCFLVNQEVPYEVRIISSNCAIITGSNPDDYLAVIDEFRFNAEHISEFYDNKEQLIAQFETKVLRTIPISEIQPSQFYINQDKYLAVDSFINTAEDVIIPVTKDKHGGYIAIDGHSRLKVAFDKGISTVLVYESQADAYIFDFVQETKSRQIESISDMSVLSHADYQSKWIDYCTDYFKK